MRSSTGDEPSAYLAGGIEITASERPSPSDGIAWSIVCRSLRLEQAQDPFGAIRRPDCDLAAIGLTQRLRRKHANRFS
ncbi:hypothetical protein BJY17_001388 [Agromyces hippuratus]|uniref:Uncharacterized protein n=1 Tax=Agromyces hippuratus TaxID=286438 RepID=A0A852X3K8_9MICO|nr:hypothetical protein [Agromyces hippuratus]